MFSKCNKLLSLFTAVRLLLIASSAPTWAADDDDTMEEIVVIGSFIRRDNFDVSSPLDVVSADGIGELGASTLGGDDI